MTIGNVSHLLTATDVDVKIIHLVRDPRATVRSLINIDIEEREVSKITSNIFRYNFIILFRTRNQSKFVQVI